jgi:putative aldouronate transport system substrate-binding protein
MKKSFRILSVLVALTVVLTLGLAGCGGQGSTAEGSTSAETSAVESTPAGTSADAGNTGIDTSTEAKLVGYLLGAAPDGSPAVFEELNKKLKQDINATMTINYIGWSELDAKYPLVLAAGDNIDWIFTADWCKYTTEAAKGAFYELTEDMLGKYMPKEVTALDPEGWKQAKIDGKIYMIPTSTPDRKGYGVTIRGDLREKYGIPEIKRVSDLEPYLDAIKKNNPEMIPINMDNTFDINAVIFYLMNETGGNIQDLFATTGSGGGVFREFDGSDPWKVFTLFDEPYYSALKDAAKVMKSWYEKGYLNKNIFANTVRSKDAFEQGKSGVGIGNTADLQTNTAKGKEMGWKVEIVQANTKAGHSIANSFLNNGVAIAQSSKNPERTMMALDLMMQDKDYSTLLQYGLEGVNHVIKDGKADLPDGVTAETNTYNWDGNGFWFVNKDIVAPRATWTDEYIKLVADLRDNVLIPDPVAGFAVSTDNIKTEVANVQNVYKQYFNTIAIGSVKDVDAAFETLKQKMEAAGLQKMRDEAAAQLAAWKTANGK